MEILYSESHTQANYPESIKSDISREVDLFNLLTRILFLNKEERFRAGIYIGYEGQDWINQTALILPPSFNED